MSAGEPLLQGSVITSYFCGHAYGDWLVYLLWGLQSMLLLLILGLGA